MVERLVDARPLARWKGEAPEPRAGVRSGRGPYHFTSLGFRVRSGQGHAVSYHPITHRPYIISSTLR